jgi:hypothetical protein
MGEGRAEPRTAYALLGDLSSHFLSFENLLAKKMRAQAQRGRAPQNCTEFFGKKFRIIAFVYYQNLIRFQQFESAGRGAEK